jgi:hypothetical protein
VKQKPTAYQRKWFVIQSTLNSYSWGITETFGLDNDQFAIDELVLQSKKLEDDDSGNSTGISTDYGSSSPESTHGHYPSNQASTATLLSIKQETSESLLMGNLSSPDNHSSSGQISDSYYSNESSNSTPDTERSGSKKTAYNEKWGVKVLKGTWVFFWLG